ncbi:MAG TPA: hypothetical protein VJH97_04550 [Candidatus Nanoarchaeia archaeon]|nr:hypothetical protein [Candidatus Nanoarchaeia archaeon]
MNIVVGTGIGGQRQILTALRDAEYDVVSTGRAWPRDHYVYFNGRYIKSGSPGSIDGNPFGEGGNIVPGHGFLLVSDMVHLHKQVSTPPQPTYSQIKEAILAEGRRQFPDTRIYVAPTGYFHGSKGHSHIDMFTLLLPVRRLLIVDTYFGKGAGTAREYDAIAEQEALRLIRFDGSADGVWYPLNGLVLSGDITAVDRKAKSLIRLLADEGVPIIRVDMPQHEHPAGKINCQTNTFNPDKISLDQLLS